MAGRIEDNRSVWSDAVYQPLLDRPRISKELTLEIRLGFVRKVYGILLAMLFVTIAVAIPMQLYLGRDSRDPISELFWVDKNEWIMFLALIVMLISSCVVACGPDVARKFPNSYVLLFIFSGSMGVLIGFSTLFYTWQTVMLAFSMTFVVVVGLTAYSYYADQEFFGWMPYLIAGQLVLFLFGMLLISLAMSGVYVNKLAMLFSFLATLLFSFFIIFDTQLILGEVGGHRVQFSVDDYAFAALTLYTDIINLFMSLLNILGSRDGPR